MTDAACDCLIGHTGFVGGSLARAAEFGSLYNSSSIAGISGRMFSTVFCCGVPGVKWRANQQPEADRAAIAALAGVLRDVKADRFVLVSTVDVYPVPRRVDESSDCRVQPNHPYGQHRLEFEEFVQGQFARSLTVRLPALFGAGLKKNVLFDLLHGNATGGINPGSSFQWYDVSRLWEDIQLATAAGLELVNLVAEPVATGDIADAFFPDVAIGRTVSASVSYDVRTLHAGVFGGTRDYAMSRVESMSRMAQFIDAQREPA